MDSTLQRQKDAYMTIGQIGYLNRLELYKTEKPYEVSVIPINVMGRSARRSNLSFRTYPFELEDFSCCRQDFNTDVQGFELESFPTSLTSEQLKDSNTIEALYYDEARIFLAQKFGAQKVFFFDNTIREAKARDTTPSTILKNNQILGPVRYAHVDQTPESARRRVEHYFPDKASQLLRHRVRLINIWRQLVWPCQTVPVGLCDWRSTVTEDFTRGDVVTPIWEGESFHMHHNPEHKWWFAKEVKENDVILIKMYDSAAEKANSGVAMCKNPPQPTT